MSLTAARWKYARIKPDSAGLSKGYPTGPKRID
jgi:hypothetical protein